MKPRQRRTVQVIAALVIAVLLPAGALVAQGLQASPTAVSPSAAALSRSAPDPWTDPPATAGDVTSPKDGALAATTDACRTAAMAVSLGPAEGAAGTVYRSLRFTNTSGRPCVLHGFPGVSYVTGDLYTQVGAAAEQEGEKTGPVTLRPKGVAYATLALVSVGSFDPALCRPAPVKGLRVYLPGDIASEFVALPGSACSGKAKGPQLRIRSITPTPGVGRG